MEKKTIKQIIFIIFISILLLVSLLNFNIILGFILKIVGLFMPLIVGCCIAFLINIILRFFEDKVFQKIKNKTFLKIKRPLSVILSFLIVLLIIALVLFLVIPELANTINLIIDNFPIYKENLETWFNNLNIDTEILNTIEDIWITITSGIGDFIENNLDNFFDITWNVTSSIFNGVVTFVLGIVFAFYILMQKERFGLESKKNLYALVKEDMANKIVKIFSISYTTFHNFIKGQVFEAILLGVLCGIGMFVMRMPYVFAISVLIAFTALIPMFGSFIGTVIGAFLIFMVSPIKALIFIIYIIVLQQIDNNFIYPKVVGKSVSLPAIWVMLAVLVGGSLLGIVGILISVPLTSVLYALFKEWVNNRLKVRKIKIEE